MQGGARFKQVLESGENWGGARCGLWWTWRWSGGDFCSSMAGVEVGCYDVGRKLCWWEGVEGC